MRKPASVPGWGATIVARPEHVTRAGRHVCFGVALALTAAVLLATAAAVTAAPIIIGDRIAVGAAPHGVAVNEATNRIYVANTEGDSVSVIGGATGTVIGTIQLPTGAGPIAVAVNETTNRIYVANVSSGSVSVIGGVSGMLVGSIQLPTGSGPRGVAVNETTNRVYVANADMRWPVNPRSLTVVLTLGFVPAGGHMGSALDHADIRGFQPHISVGPEPGSH